MRMELPDRYSDLMAYQNPTLATMPPGIPPSILIVAPGFNFIGPTMGGPTWIPSTHPLLSMTPTAVNMSYQRKISANGTVPSADYEDAECLYLILNTGLTDDTVAGELINPENVGDADADGMPEFQDAWGRPIRFIRWAPGFISDLQPYDLVNSPTDPHFTAKNHDPFDPLKMQHPFPSKHFKRPSVQSDLNELSFPMTATSVDCSDGKALVPLDLLSGQDGIDGLQRPPAVANGFGLPIDAFGRQLHLVCQFHNFCRTPVGDPVFPFTSVKSTIPLLSRHPRCYAAESPHCQTIISSPASNRGAVLSSAPSYPNNFVPIGAALRH